MDEPRPRVFVASSTEGLKVAEKIQEGLQHDAEVTLWSQNVFDISSYALDDLVKQLDLFNYGIFVFSFDDISIIRKERAKTTRDNVLFELGLFIGRIGRERCFIIMPKSKQRLHQPTDLLGIRMGIYDPRRSDSNLLAALGPALTQIKDAMARQGKRNKKKAKLEDFLAQMISQAGVSAFYQSRKDYAVFRADACSIDSYCATATDSLHMISINLMTGVPFDGLCSMLADKLKGSLSFTATISLLNPWKRELMESLAPVLDMTAEDLAKSIKDTLSALSKMKNGLSKEEKKRFQIKVHDAIPFGSAIIIDGKSGKGKIQIETKPFKAPLKSSFGFEISDQGTNPLYTNLCGGYLRLIQDGTGYETILKSLKHRESRGKRRND